MSRCILLQFLSCFYSCCSTVKSKIFCRQISNQQDVFIFSRMSWTRQFSIWFALWSGTLGKKQPEIEPRPLPTRPAWGPSIWRLFLYGRDAIFFCFWKCLKAFWEIKELPELWSFMWSNSNDEGARSTGGLSNLLMRISVLVNAAMLYFFAVY